MKLKTFAILFAFLIVVIIVLADRRQLGMFGFVYAFPYGDKIVHFLLFGILSFLVNLAFVRSLPKSYPPMIIFRVTVVLAILIGIEEWSQRFFPDRTSDRVDLMFSYMGVALGAWLAARQSRNQSKQTPNS